MAVRNGIIGVATTVALVLGGGAIGSAEAASAQVTAKNVPTLAQVAKVAPAFKGGITESKKIKAFVGNTGDCRPEGRRTALQSGRVAHYWSKPTRDGRYPHSAAVEVSRFTNKKQAKRAVSDYAAYLENCKEEAAEVGTTLKEAAMPKLGDQRMAMTMTFAPKESGVTSTTTILVRKGRTVVQTIQWAPKLRVSPTIQLEKLALKRAR